MLYSCLNIKYNFCFEFLMKYILRVSKALENSTTSRLMHQLWKWILNQVNQGLLSLKGWSFSVEALKFAGRLSSLASSKWVMMGLCQHTQTPSISKLQDKYKVPSFRSLKIWINHKKINLKRKACVYNCINGFII